MVMDKEKWSAMSDEQKTSFMRKVFKEMNFGECFDYSKCRSYYEKMSKMGHWHNGAYENPCIVLQLVDPIMAADIFAWMYMPFDENGEPTEYTKGNPAPLFGYNLVEFVLDKHSLMDFSDKEKEILREAMRIIGEKTKKSEL